MAGRGFMQESVSYEEVKMQAKIGNLKVDMFKIKNRKGYAAVCSSHLTEGKTTQQALERMAKAIRRTTRKK